MTDARGVRLVAHVTAANVNDITHLDALVADAAGGRAGGPTSCKATVATIRNHIVIASPPLVAIFGRRRTSHGSGLGVFRWVVERTLAWLHRFRRLAVRYERHDRVHHAFLTLGCALICWNYLKSTRRVF